MPFLPSPRLWSKRARRRGAAHRGGLSDGGFWETIGDLAFPRWCAGCGEWDEDLCPECVARFSGPWRRVDERAPYLNLVRPASGGSHGLLRPGDAVSPFPVFALADYDDVVRKVIVSWKNTVNQGLTEELVRAVRQRARDIEVREEYVSIVPAPSRFRRRHDGRFVAGHLGRAIGAGINGGQGSAGISLEGAAVYRDVLTTSGSALSSLLRLRPTSQYLGGRGAKGRGIRARSGLPGDRAILVDDVLTSGATLAGSARALGERGVEVIAAFVVAAAHDPRESDTREAGRKVNGR